VSALLELVRQLPDEDLAAAARALEDEALAGIIRELPTDALIRLVTGEVIDRDAKPAKVSKPRRAKPKAPAEPRRRKASTSREDRPDVAAARERADRVLGYLEEHGESRGADIARALKLSIPLVGTSLRQLAAEGKAVSNGKGGRGCAYRPAGRQTSRKAAKPSKPSADEEEGGRAVKLSAAAPAIQLGAHASASSVRLVVGGKPVLELEQEDEDRDAPARWKPTPVLHDVPNIPAVLAPPVEPEQASAPTDRIRCVPYRSTISTLSCLERQAAAGTGPRREGNWVSGGGAIADH